MRLPASPFYAVSMSCACGALPVMYLYGADNDIMLLYSSYDHAHDMKCRKLRLDDTLADMLDGDRLAHTLAVEIIGKTYHVSQ